MAFYFLLLTLIMISCIIYVFYEQFRKIIGLIEPHPELSKSKQTKKIIVTYKGSSYDISDFIKFHPGGKDVLIENNGNDVEKLMLENQHSIEAYEKLEKYKIKN